MNALTFVLIDLVLLFTLPKIYRVYQVSREEFERKISMGICVQGTYRSYIETNSRSD